LRVYKNTVLEIIFGPKREEVAGGWRKLHNEELLNFYASPNVVVPMLPLTEHHAMKAYWGSGGTTPPNL
jgi:hypothetical protein